MTMMRCPKAVTEGCRKCFTHSVEHKWQSSCNITNGICAVACIPVETVKPQWQDRPDKAGWWWTSRIKNREWTTPNMMHLTTKDDANVILDLGYRWLYIPEPELPEVK